MQEINWDETLTLGAKKEEKPNEERLSLDALLDDIDIQSSQETEEVAASEAENQEPLATKPKRPVYKDEPKTIDTPKATGGSLLDTIEGEVGEASTRAVLKSPVSAKRNVARFNNGQFEIIGLAPITVIEATDQEIALMQADHLLKSGTLSEAEKKEAYEFETANLEAVKRLFAVESIAELNGISEEELSRYFRKELKESTKIMLENVMKETGISEVSTETISALAAIESPTERDIFKAIIRELK